MFPAVRNLAFLSLLLLSLPGCPSDPPVVPGTDAGPTPDVPLILCESDDDCDDGLYCSGEENCVAGRCVRTRVDCDDGLTCTTDRCSEERLACVHTAPDVDGDGYFARSCVDADGDPLGNDCDDDDDTTFPGGTEICDGEHDEDCDPETLGGIDDDSDGFVSAACCNGATCGDDCDDARDGSYPGATEVCDGLDQNCDGTADDGVALPGWEDHDGDGWGGTTPRMACADAAGWAPEDHGGDCVDEPTAEVTNPRAVNPGQPEICDGIRNDCDTTLDADVGAGAVTWYVDADSDGFGDPSVPSTVSCVVVPGASLLGTDCDDAEPTRNPAATELCNGLDDNCNERADYRIGANDFEDDDDDGLFDSACTGGTDCNDTDPASGPGELERCDGRDNDCDTIVDEGATSVVYYRDMDGDTYGSPASGTIVACMSMVGYVPLAGDCNDTDANRHPGAIDACNGADEDCDAAVDEMPAGSMCSAPNASEVACVSGRCESTFCVTGYGDCNGRGVDGCETDLRTDELHCGTCPNACGPGETCTAGVCVSGCAPGQVFCAGACIDPTRDEAYCGATSPCSAATDGVVCSVDAVCAGGVCSSSFILPGGDVSAGTMPRTVNYRIDTPGPATIYYTLDGTTPGSSPTTLSGTAPRLIPLSTGQTVRWYALYTGGSTGPLQSYTHTTSTDAQVNLGVVGENLNMNAGGPVISVTGGTAITATVDALHWKSSGAGYCPGCVVFSQIVFNGAVVSCLNSSVPWPGTSFPGRAFSMTAPTAPGRYPVYLSLALDYSCQPIGAGQIIGYVFVR